MRSLFLGATKLDPFEYKSEEWRKNKDFLSFLSQTGSWFSCLHTTYKKMWQVLQKGSCSMS